MSHLPNLSAVMYHFRSRCDRLMCILAIPPFYDDSSFKPLLPLTSSTRSLVPSLPLRQSSCKRPRSTCHTYVNRSDQAADPMVCYTCPTFFPVLLASPSPPRLLTSGVVERLTAVSFSSTVRVDLLIPILLYETVFVADVSMHVWHLRSIPSGLGYILIAGSTSLGMLAAGNIIYSLGYTGLQVMTQVRYRSPFENNLPKQKNSQNQD